VQEYKYIYINSVSGSLHSKNHMVLVKILVKWQNSNAPNIRG